MHIPLWQVVLNWIALITAGSFAWSLAKWCYESALQGSYTNMDIALVASAVIFGTVSFPAMLILLIVQQQLNKRLMQPFDHMRALLIAHSGICILTFGGIWLLLHETFGKFELTPYLLFIMTFSVTGLLILGINFLLYKRKRRGMDAPANDHTSTKNQES